MSGFNSPAVSSPSCEIKNELTFPSLPTNNQQPQQLQTAMLVQQSQNYTEVAAATKVTPKISQLSELEEQLSKIHQKPFSQSTQQQQLNQSHTTTYSDAVRQSPTTVQQQFPQTSVIQQAVPQTQPPVTLNSIASPVVTAVTSSAQKGPSRFQVSKVEEQKQTILNQQQQQQTIPSPSTINILKTEIEVTNMNTQPILQTQQVFQNTPQMQQPQPPTIVQSSQAQAFFQQHQGGVVSKK